MAAACALAFGAGLLTLLHPAGQARSARGAAVCLTLAAMCVGWNHGISDGQWTGVLGALIVGLAGGSRWGR